ncbi:MAG TPA: hypothetical protein PLJ62_08980 [Thermoflexales bacterium]|nr:hypothetical protein [Thermoflexales bacterium]HQW35477.1 hypothetical protein [Thermoflexales bacterium]HRA00319.1 hypothetical protein [Thermoflexales bacterium]
MNPQLGKAWFQVGVFITIVSVILLFVLQPKTAEYVITVLSLIIGLALMALVIIAIKFFSR